jgi:hypothetical protein
LPEARPEQAGMLLTINNERALLASDFGNLLTSIARDYRQFNRGRDLAIANVYSGSVSVELIDVLVAAKPYLVDGVQIAIGTKAIIEFMKAIKDLLARKKDARTERATDVKRDPYRTAEAMIKIAAQNHNNIRIKTYGPRSENFEVELSSMHAKDIRQREKERKIQSVEATPRTTDIVDLADEIQRLRATDADALRALINAVVQMLLRTRNGRLVEVLAKELERRGYTELAAQVRGTKSA